MLNRIKSNNSSKQTKDFKEKEKEVVEFDFGGWNLNFYGNLKFKLKKNLETLL